MLPHTLAAFACLFSSATVVITLNMFIEHANEQRATATIMRWFVHTHHICLHLYRFVTIFRFPSHDEPNDNERLCIREQKKKKKNKNQNDYRVIWGHCGFFCSYCCRNYWRSSELEFLFPSTCLICFSWCTRWHLHLFFAVFFFFFCLFERQFSFTHTHTHTHLWSVDVL